MSLHLPLPPCAGVEWILKRLGVLPSVLGFVSLAEVASN